jgi:hypothetical protein
MANTTQGPVGPKPDQEPLNDFLDRVNERIGENQRCPMCGATEWATMTVNPAGINLIDMPDAGPAELGSIRIALLYCAHCRFIRTHLTAP